MEAEGGRAVPCKAEEAYLYSLGTKGFDASIHYFVLSH